MRSIVALTGAGLPPVRAGYPRPGSARIWDTDLFEDSNRSSGQTLRIPTGRSRVVQALHRAGHYSICYVEAGAFQAGLPDVADFAAVDYGRGRIRHRMRGYPDEWWFDLAGFRDYVAGDPASLKGAAVNIAAGLARRFAWCGLEGQDAVEPDDPCAGRGGDWSAYLAAGKPVLDAEYSEDGETTAKFCASDRRWRIWGALFGVALDGARGYRVCWGSSAALRTRS